MKKMVTFFTRICEAYLPDAFVFSLLLTLLVYVVALFVTPHSPLDLISFWGKDFWALNAFAMQMVFILISGHMLATTPFVDRFLKRICSLVTTESQALLLISTFSVLACFMNWGFGLIVSGILAVELARKLKRVNFALLVASGYAGFLVWHGGISGSIPLKIAGTDEILTRVWPGVSIPLSSTIFSAWNLTLVGSLFLILPVLSLWMNDHQQVDVPLGESQTLEQSTSSSFRDRLEQSRLPNLLFGAFFLIALLSGLQRGESFDINKLNTIFLALAIVLHGTPARFLVALQRSVGYAAGIIIQFPFYAGLMGLMQYSGLADQVSLAFVEISSAKTLPMWTFLSAGIVNFFIPSGGGQWVVQGPIMLKAAKELGADPAKVAMALAWGDAWTNLIQPFWALPILALARLRLKDIMGYCLTYTIVSGLIITALLFLS